MGEDNAVYQAVEYAGPFIESLSIEDRLLFPLMAIDLGAKGGFINPDAKTRGVRKSAFAQRSLGNIRQRSRRTKYQKVVDIDVEHAGAAGRLSADGRQREADR